jgi:hypothetical protein
VAIKGQETLNIKQLSIYLVYNHHIGNFISPF